MNALSLRVSSIRNGENLKKNSEIRVAVLSLPDQHQLVEPTDADNNCVVDLENVKREFAAATSIDQQLVTIRHCFTTLSDDIASHHQLAAILQLLADLFFHAPLKHPVRNAVAKLLQKSQHLHGHITESLVRAIHHQTAVIRLPETGLRRQNDAINSLGGCFDNFPCALAACRMSLPAVCAAIAASLQRYSAELLGDDALSSPAQRSELFIFTHCAMRLALSAGQLCLVHSSEDSNSVECSLLQIADACETLIAAADVPMDTKVNAGQFMLLHAKLGDRERAVFAEIVAANIGADNVRLLVLCVGTVSSIVEDHLSEDLGCAVLHSVVQHLLSIATANAIEQNVLIAAARGLVQLSKALLQFKLTAISAEQRGSLQRVGTEMLRFVWSFAEHYLDSVRHLSRDLLRNLLKLAAKHPSLFDAVLAGCVAVARADMRLSSAAVRCLCIDQMALVFGATTVRQHIPDVGAVMLDNLSEPNWSQCYEKLMVSDAAAPLPEWYERWLVPVLSSRFALAMEAIISAAIRQRPDVIDLLLAAKAALPIETYLLVVGIGRRTALKPNAAWQPAEDPVLRAAHWHSSDAVRIAALRVLVEVPRSTEAFSETELSAILEFLRYNSNVQCPSMRMQIVAQMTKCVQRVEASHAVAQRHKDGGHQAGVNIGFLLGLRELCVGNLFEGSNFSRRSISLQLLRLTMRALQKCRPEAETDTAASVWTPRLLRKLRETVESDTYESNKALALEVLRACPLAANPVANAPADMLAKLSTMLTSCRPGESLSAAYLAEYCCVFRWHFDSPLAAIEWCETLMLRGLQMAEQSLRRAARENPLYGLVACIKHLIGGVDLRSVDVAEWRPFCARFRRTCSRLLAVVAPIVNSDSPEGFMPDDNTAEAEAAAAAERGDTTAQMLLLCAWRTVKEVSGVLGDLALRAPHSLLTVDELLAVGGTFQQLLAETRHRGAFEQAYVGFSMLCVRLWRSAEPRLHRCPMRWLRRLLDLIGGGEESDGGEQGRGESEEADTADEESFTLRAENICATRRSAGIPFMIQALITAELQVCSATALHYSMHRLLQLASNHTTPTSTASATAIDTRTHALNILRALFRCTDLADAVAEHCAAAIETAIRGYSAATWPERNSATLLFAALMTRIFGVQRFRHSAAASAQLHIRNRMTGRIFFLRYPQLYNFIAAELATAAAAMDGGRGEGEQRPATLHPLLLLLGRLYPSALEGSESSLQLSAFVPAVLECTASAELETRRLAVRSLAALLAPAAVLGHCEQVLQRMADGRSSNAWHGALLQIAGLVKAMTPKRAAEQQTELRRLLGAMLALRMFERPHYVLVAAYLAAICELLLQLPSGCGQDELTAMHRLVRRCQRVLSDRRTATVCLVGRPEAQKMAVLFSALQQIRNNAIREDFILYRGGLAEQSAEHRETVLNLMQLILDESLRQQREEVANEEDADDDEYAFTTMECAVVAAISAQQITVIAGELKRSAQLKAELLLLTREAQFYPVHSTKAFVVLSHLPASGMPVAELLMLIASLHGKPDSVRNAMLKWITVNLPTTMPQQHCQVIGQLLPELLAASDPNAADQLRLTAAICLCRLPEPRHNPLLFLDYCDLVLIFLRDDDFYVRDQMARFVRQLGGGDNGDIGMAQTVPISVRAEEMFLQWLAQTSRSGDGYSNISMLGMQLLRRQLSETEGVAKVSADPTEVFNKNEANLYGEQLNTARLVYVWLEAFEGELNADTLKAYRQLREIVFNG